MHEILEVFSNAAPEGRFHSLCIFPNGTATAVFPLVVHKFNTLEELEVCAEILKEKLIGPRTDLPPPEPPAHDTLIGEFNRGKQMTRK